MAQIGKETIERILEATDIVDLISSYLQLKRAGSQFRANCPFHSEKTPSFYVTPSMQRFHCFGCGKGGDAISFVRDYENLPFIDAVQKLAQRAGIQFVEELSSPQEIDDRRQRGRLLDLHREAADFFHRQLLRNPQAAHARSYLKDRGFGADMAKRWTIGWMPEDPHLFTQWVKSRSFSEKELVASGMAALRNEERPEGDIYVRFRDRLMFPIRNEMGDVIAFSGRQLKEDPNSGKYINSPETAIYRKGNVLFALERARKAVLKEKAALLCEGQIDVIACHEAGVEHAIAPLGTAFTADHARLLRRYTQQVVICYDADRAGFAAAERAFRELVTHGVGVRVAEMSAGDDPDTFLRREGAEAFRARLAAAREFFDFKLGRAGTGGLLDSASGRASVTHECAELLAGVTDAIVRDQQINVVAGYLQIAPGAMREAIQQAIVKERSRPRASRREERHGGDQAAPTGPMEPTPMHRVVSVLSRLALSSAQAQHFLGEQYESIHEAKRWLEGVDLLEKILASAPDPQSPAGINLFLASLPEADRLALTQDPFGEEGTPGDGLSAAEDGLAMLCATVLHRRDVAVKEALKQPKLTAERMIELLEEAKEIGRLLKGTERFETYDDLAPSTYRPKEPEWKTRWRQKRGGV